MATSQRLSLPHLTEFVRYLVIKSSSRRVILIVPDPMFLLMDLPDDRRVTLICHGSDLQGATATTSHLHIRQDLEIGLGESMRDVHADCVVVCVGLIEHLDSPHLLLRDLAVLSRMCRYVVLATPDRVRTYGFASLPGKGWTAAEFGALLTTAGFRCGFHIGYTTTSSDENAKTTVMVLSGTDATFIREVNHLNVAAIMHVFNELDIIEASIRYLANMGVAVHVIDDGSEDGTYEKARALQTLGLCVVVRRQEPAQSTHQFALEAQLAFTEAYARDLECDWILHYDADEFRESPWPDVSLVDGLAFVDALGYNAVDFTLVNFVFRNGAEATSFIQADYSGYDFGRHPAHKKQVKAWKQQQVAIELKKSGGHVVSFDGLQVFPLKFLTKHYPLRSVAHANRKLFHDRIPRFDPREREKGWHNQYDLYQALAVVRPWRVFETSHYAPHIFSAEHVIERLSGVGIETEEKTILNVETVFALVNETFSALRT